MPIERAVGRMMINALLPQGLGSNAIINAIRDAGYSYRRTDMLSDIRSFAGRAMHESQVKSLTGNSVIPQSYMVDTELKMPYNYRVFGDADILDDETDVVTRTTKSFYTNDLAAKEDWENEFISVSQEGYSTEGQAITNFQIKSVEHNTGYPF